MEDVKEVKAKQRYLITLSDGKRINGTFKSSEIGKVLIDDEESIGNLYETFIPDDKYE